MTEEEKKAIELLENIKNSSWTTKYIMSSDSKNAEILLNLIENYKKENEELKADNYELNNRITDLLENIPVQKIKDKIEELKKKVEELTDEQGYWGGSDLLEQIKVLQELVEERK